MTHRRHFVSLLTTARRVLWPVAFLAVATNAFSAAAPRKPKPTTSTPLAEWVEPEVFRVLLNERGKRLRCRATPAW